jgi:galactose mutarotase-like enzyme
MGFEEIVETWGESSFTVSPARGALVTSLRVRGRELLFLDRVTFEDPAKNVRGGIPVLFPYAGKLAGETFRAAGTRMPQHGFARQRAWSTSRRHPGLVAMALAADAASRAVYPYEFTAEQSCTLLASGLHVELLVTNTGPTPLPVSPGWHPYFRCPAAQKPNVRGDVPGLTADSFTNAREFDFGLPAPASGRARFELPGLGTLALSFCPEMRHLQFWSQPGKDFVCLEPFWGANDTINGPNRRDIEPGASGAFWMRIELES